MKLGTRLVHTTKTPIETQNSVSECGQVSDIQIWITAQHPVTQVWVREDK